MKYQCRLGAEPRAADTIYISPGIKSTTGTELE